MVRLRQWVAFQIAFCGGMESPAQGGWKPDRPQRAQHDAATANAAEGVIDAVDAGAGHNAKDKEWLHQRPLKIGH
jgi:hypothetical protein